MKNRLSRIPLESEIIYKNEHVHNIYGACTACYDNTKSLTYFEKKTYIEKRINAGHDSILEHGRLAIKIKNINQLIDIVDLTTYEYSKYLEFYSIHREDGMYNLIINGNMRSFKHFFINTTRDDYDYNPLVRQIHYILIDNTVGELYGTKFKMYDKKPDFIDMEYVKNYNDKKYINCEYMAYDTLILDKTIDMVLTNKPEPIKKVDIGIDTDYIDSLVSDPDISEEVLLNILTVGVVFKNMSRTATHQLVRHRNAITQESQRYVSAKNATFTIPVSNYSDNKKYNITLFDQTKQVNLIELADELLKVYEQLINSGLKKEEARAYLPSNVNCGKLFMTFSLSNLLAFLKLRTDKHAQFEIRQYALAIKEAISITSTTLASFKLLLEDTDN